MTRRPLVISGARVLTDPARPAVEDGAVLVRDGRVVAVARRDELAAVAGAELEDHPGATILPGLVNAHCHLAFDVTGDPRPAFERRDHDALRATIAANARAALGAGITTVRDLGDADGLVAAFRDRVAAGAAEGPRVLSALSPLTSPGGHCWFLGGEVDTTAGGAATLRAAVARRADAGADVIKVMAGGGFMTPTGAPPWDAQFDADELAVVVDAAHAVGLPVAAHAHGATSMAAGARAGVDTVEHGSWRAAPAADGTARYDVRPEVADALAAAGAAVVPTRARNWGAWPPDARPEEHLERLRTFDRHGVPILVGNDAGVGQGWFDDLSRTLHQLHDLGWSRPRVLAAATGANADALGLGERTGRLTAGRDADLLVVDGDPRDDLDALSRIRLVLARGRRLAATAHEGTATT